MNVPYLLLFLLCLSSCQVNKSFLRKADPISITANTIPTECQTSIPQSFTITPSGDTLKEYVAVFYLLEPPFSKLDYTCPQGDTEITCTISESSIYSGHYSLSHIVPNNDETSTDYLNIDPITMKISLPPFSSIRQPQPSNTSTGFDISFML